MNGCLLCLSLAPPFTIVGCILHAPGYTILLLVLVALVAECLAVAGPSYSF